MKMDEWISVENRLPERQQNILAYGERSLIWSGTRLGTYQVEFSQDDDGDYWISGGNRTLKNVTHWMPLPDPPEDNKG